MTDDQIIERIKKDVVQTVDGYYYFFPLGGSAYNGHTLRVIADYLDKINKEWNDLVDKETQ